MDMRPGIIPYVKNGALAERTNTGAGLPDRIGASARKTALRNPISRGCRDGELRARPPLPLWGNLCPAGVGVWWWGGDGQCQVGRSIQATDYSSQPLHIDLANYATRIFTLVALLQYRIIYRWLSVWMVIDDQIFSRRFIYRPMGVGWEGDVPRRPPRRTRGDALPGQLRMAEFQRCAQFVCWANQPSSKR